MGRSRRVIAPRFLVVVIGIRRRVLELSRSPPPRTRKGGLFIPVISTMLGPGRVRSMLQNNLPASPWASDPHLVKALHGSVLSLPLPSPREPWRRFGYCLDGGDDSAASPSDNR